MEKTDEEASGLDSASGALDSVFSVEVMSTIFLRLREREVGINADICESRNAVTVLACRSDQRAVSRPRGVQYAERERGAKIKQEKKAGSENAPLQTRKKPCQAA